MTAIERVSDTLKGLGVPVYLHAWTPRRKDDMPPPMYVTYSEMLEQGEAYSDDEETTTSHIMAVDVWASGNTQGVSQRIKAAMKSIGFTRRDERDIYEADTRTYHRALVFANMEESEGD